MNMNKYRKFVTSSVGFTFVVVGITGVIFQFFFKNHVLQEIHGWLGVAMVVVAVTHTLQNWKSLQSHLRDWRVFILLLPMVLVMAFFAFGQKQASREVNPKEVIAKLAQANADGLATALGKDVNLVFALMKSDGLQVVGADKTVQQLAQENKKSPASILVYFVK